MDEAAYSYFPYVQRTYHRKGKRCIAKHGPLHGGVQSISFVIPSGRLYFRLRQGSFKSEDVVDFLADLLKRFKRKKLIIIWDGVAIHRSKKIKEFLRTKARGRIHLVQLPPYSPQLNADEQVHSLIKTQDFKNRLFTSIEELEAHVRQSFEKLSDKHKTIAIFFKHKEVGFYPV